MQEVQQKMILPNSKWGQAKEPITNRMMSLNKILENKILCKEIVQKQKQKLK